MIFYNDSVAFFMQAGMYLLIGLRADHDFLSLFFFSSVCKNETLECRHTTFKYKSSVLW